MAKDTFYFSHDYNARNDPKILELRSEYGLEGYGLYWCLIETMAEDKNGVVIASLIGGLSIGYGIPKNKLMEIINFMVKLNLLQEQNGTIYSKRLLEHKMKRKHLSDKGREGAIKKWEKINNDRHPNSPPIGDANAKERKGNKNKEKENNRGFIKPTTQEIADYCKERGNNVSPSTFFDFYESKGWLIGKTKMKDWKAAVRTWEKNNQARTPQLPFNNQSIDSKKSYPILD